MNLQIDMKIVLHFAFLVFFVGSALGQSKADAIFSVTLQMPKSVKQGEHRNLSAKIKNISGKEFSGMAVLEIISTENGRPIDGWFQNIFPQQYFTIEGDKSGLVNFDVHVPYNVSTPVKCKVIFNVGQKMISKEAIIKIQK